MPRIGQLGSIDTKFLSQQCKPAQFYLTNGNVQRKHVAPYVTVMSQWPIQHLATCRRDAPSHW